MNKQTSQVYLIYLLEGEVSGSRTYGTNLGELN